MEVDKFKITVSHILQPCTKELQAYLVSLLVQLLLYNTYQRSAVDTERKCAALISSSSSRKTGCGFLRVP